VFVRSNLNLSVPPIFFRPLIRRFSFPLQPPTTFDDSHDSVFPSGFFCKKTERASFYSFFPFHPASVRPAALPGTHPSLAKHSCLPDLFFSLSFACLVLCLYGILFPPLLFVRSHLSLPKRNLQKFPTLNSPVFKHGFTVFIRVAQKQMTMCAIRYAVALIRNGILFSSLSLTYPKSLLFFSKPPAGPNFAADPSVGAVVRTWNSLFPLTPMAKIH